MKVGIFSPYWQTFGGGERYLLTVAEYFQNRGDSVNIFWKGEHDKAKIRLRFDIDLSKVEFVSDIFQGKSNIFHRLRETSKFDLIFYLSDGSVPSLLSKKNILHFQVPFNLPNQQTLANKLKFKKISHVVCNSYFTKKYIDKTYGIESDVIYPPVDVEKFHPGKKENIILSVGRFFGPSNSKKHDILINTFTHMLNNKIMQKWRLILIGGITEGSESEVVKMRKLAKDYPVEILTDSSFSVLQKNYTRAKIYWHAAGFGEDLENHPEKAEHFGISTVEAMAAGCVPIVFAGGGQLEIVQEGQSGFLWETTDELAEKTLKLISDQNSRSQITAEAIGRSKKFSKERFFTELGALV